MKILDVRIFLSIKNYILKGVMSDLFKDLNFHFRVLAYVFHVSVWIKISCRVVPRAGGEWKV